MRAFLNGLAHQLVPAPLVEVKGSPDVDVSLNRVRGKLAINLVNTSGPHWDSKKPLVDSIAPVGPLEVALRCPAKPTTITLQPEGRSLAFDYSDGQVKLTVPRLDIHSILMVE